MGDRLTDLVTIGIPAYNEERFIKDAVLSCLHQSRHIVICDNASEDETEAICRQLAEEHSNITYVRHATNIGALGNFKFALDSARTRYFMWLGAHDLLPETYVEALLNALTIHQDAVLAYAPARRINAAGNHIGTYHYLYANALASRRASERVHTVIRYLDHCSLLHGIVRTESARAAWFGVSCIGCDNVFLSKAAVLGKFVYVDSTRYIRREFRDNDSMVAQLHRISAGEHRVECNYDEMASRQLDIAGRVQEGNVFMRLVRKERARASLVRRYGPFETGNRMDRMRNLLWYWSFRLIAKASGALHHSRAWLIREGS